MSHATGGGNFVTQSSFGSYGNFIFGGLATNNESRAAPIFRGGSSAGAVFFFADNERSPIFRTPLARSCDAASIIATIIPFASQEPRP